MKIIVYGTPAPQGSKRIIYGKRVLIRQDHIKPCEKCQRPIAFTKKAKGGWYAINATTGTPTEDGAVFLSRTDFHNCETGAFSAPEKALLIEVSKRLPKWRRAVTAAAKEAMNGAAPLDGPLSVRMVFSMKRPKHHFRFGTRSHLVRDTGKRAAPKRPHGQPDLSKLLRSTEDALTDARVWRDDSLVVEYERSAKVYVNEDPDALDAPGVMIEIARLT